MSDDSEFLGDIEKAAKNSLSIYFADKVKHKSKQKITEEELHSDFCMKTLLRTPFEDECFNYIHANCLPKMPKPEGYDDPTLEWTVHVLLGLLREQMKLNLPKTFQPGLLLLYFHFCHGIEIPQPSIL